MFGYEDRGMELPYGCDGVCEGCNEPFEMEGQLLCGACEEEAFECKRCGQIQREDICKGCLRPDELMFDPDDCPDDYGVAA